MSRGTLLILLAFSLTALLACEEPPPDDPPDPGECALDAGEEPVVELSHYFSPYGDIGETIYCGIPPQGGAPYSPFGVRLRGLDLDADDGTVTVAMRATDVDTGELVGTADYTERFLCSNVGDNEGYWVGAELHLRYFGYELTDLDTRVIRLEVEATSVGGDVLTTAVIGALDCAPGDR